MLKWLGRLLLALLLSLLLGLAIGTALRLRLERPVYYIGAGDGWVAPVQGARSGAFSPPGGEAVLDVSQRAFPKPAIQPHLRVSVR